MSINRSHIALLIGIEYLGTNDELLGCQRDVTNMHKMLTEQLGFTSNNIHVLTESSGQLPTQANILASLDQLVTQAKQYGSSEVIIYYSGHGLQMLDRDQNVETRESDGMDEVLVPLDHHNGLIRDDTLQKYLSQFPTNCICLGIFDSCNSGTVVDLPYKYQYDPQTATCTPTRDTVHTPYNNTVISVSGCKDWQTSSVVREGGEWNSALTTAIRNILGPTQQHVTLYQLQKSLIDYMIQNDLEQRPVVCCSWEAPPGTLLLTKRPNVIVKQNPYTELDLVHGWLDMYKYV